MPMSAILRRTSDNVRCIPLYPSDADRIHVNIPPSTTIAKGTVLGQTANAANAVQTITAPGSGTYTLTFTNPLTGSSGTTTALAFGANDATVLAALQLVVTATGGGTVAVSSLAVTFSGALAGRPVPLMTASAGSVANTTVGRTAGTYSAYVGGSGTDPAKLIMEYTVTSRADGRLFIGETADASYGESLPSCPAWAGGTFKISDLTGLDAGAVVDMGGTLLAGTVTDGIFKF